jgi:serine/threonine-protein kinase
MKTNYCGNLFLGIFLFILISSSKEIKLSDFGLARDIRFLKSYDDETKGTLKYLCPNYLTTGELNFSTDIFSLGLVAFELVTGSVPFESENIMDTLKERVYENSPKISDLLSDCPESFSNIVAKCLALSKTDRYSSASELVKDLEKAAIKIRRENKTTSRIKLFKEMPVKRRQGTIINFGEKSVLKIA